MRDLRDAERVAEIARLTDARATDADRTLRQLTEIKQLRKDVDDLSKTVIIANNIVGDLDTKLENLRTAAERWMRERDDVEGWMRAAIEARL